MKFRDIDRDTLPDGSSFLVKAIHRTATILARRTGRELSKVTAFNVIEWRVASGLHAFGKASQRDLVEYTGGDQAQTSRILSSFVERGLVHSEKSGIDKRARNFELTEEGVMAVENALPIIARFFSRIDAELDENEQATLIGLLNRVLNAAEKTD